MLKVTLFITTIMISSWAMSPDDIVTEALKKNNDLKSLQHSIKISNEQIKLSKKWNNPTLSLGVNNIQFDDISRRDLEPMQGQFIGFSQVVPLGDKLEIQEQIAIKDKQIAQYTLANEQQKLTSKIHELSYTILVFEKKRELLEKYQHNILRIEQLLNALYENGKSTQSQLLNTQVNYNNIQRKKISLDNAIAVLYLKLEQISYTKVQGIEQSLSMDAFIQESFVKNHPQLKLYEHKIQQQYGVSKLEDEKKFSDIKVNLTYVQRDAKYEDYANLSVNIPLSVYKTEDVKSIKAKLKAQQLQYDLKTMEQNFLVQTKILKQELLTARENHTLLMKKILPLKRQIQTNMEAYNSLDKILPQQLIQSLNEVIRYELLALDEVKNYFTAYSNLLYYTQGSINE